MAAAAGLHLFEAVADGPDFETAVMFFLGWHWILLVGVPHDEAIIGREIERAFSNNISSGQSA
jgi:hypothetical protein